MIRIILVRHGERFKSPGVGEARQTLTRAGRETVANTAEWLSRAEIGHIDAIYSSHFGPCIATAEILKKRLGIGGFERWDELTPGHSGDGLSEKIITRGQSGGFRSIILVGHDPRLSDLIAQWGGRRTRIVRGEACWLDLKITGGRAEIGAVHTMKDVDRMPTVTKPPSETGQTVGLIAELAVGLNTIAELERAKPMAGKRIEDFAIRIQKICNTAYENLIKTLEKVSQLASPPPDAEFKALMMELAATYDHAWFKDVTHICAKLAALREEFGQSLYKYAGEPVETNGIHAMIDAIYEGERSFEDDIAETATRIEKLVRHSRRTGDILPAADAAAEAREQIRKGQRDMAVSLERVIGSAPDGARKLMEAKAEAVLREDPYFMYKASSLLLIVALAAGTAVARTVPFYMFPLVTAFALTSVVVIGALQLRASGKLGEANFLKLMQLALLKFFAPLMRTGARPHE